MGTLTELLQFFLLCRTGNGSTPLVNNSSKAGLKLNGEGNAHDKEAELRRSIRAQKLAQDALDKEEAARLEKLRLSESEALKLLAKKEKIRLSQEQTRLEKQQLKDDKKQEKQLNKKLVTAEERHADELEKLRTKMERSNDKVVAALQKQITKFEKKAEADAKNMEALVLTESQQVITFVL